VSAPPTPDRGDAPITDTFPGAVHSPLLCPVCGLLWGIHRVAKFGARKGYIWRLTASGETKVCIPSVIIEPPPTKRR